MGSGRGEEEERRKGWGRVKTSSYGKKRTGTRSLKVQEILKPETLNVDRRVPRVRKPESNSQYS